VKSGQKDRRGKLITHKQWRATTVLLLVVALGLTGCASQRVTSIAEENHRLNVAACEALISPPNLDPRVMFVPPGPLGDAVYLVQGWMLLSELGAHTKAVEQCVARFEGGDVSAGPPPRARPLLGDPCLPPVLPYSRLAGLDDSWTDPCRKPPSPNPPADPYYVPPLLPLRR